MPIELEVVDMLNPLLQTAKGARDSRAPTTLARLDTYVMATCIRDQQPEGIPERMLVVQLVDDPSSTWDRPSGKVSQHPNFDELVEDLNTVAAKPRRQIVD